MENSLTLSDRGGAQQTLSVEGVREMLAVVEARVNKAEMELRMIDTRLGDLKQPLTVALCLSELLLTDIEQTHPLAADLMRLNQHIKRISDIVETACSVPQKTFINEMERM